MELVDTLEGGLVAQIKAGVTRREVTVKGEDELEEERGLALSLIDVLAGDDGLDVGTQLVMEGMAEWEVWNVEEEDVVEGYEGAVCKVVKYPSQSKSAANDKDLKLKVGDNVNRVIVNDVTATDVMDKSAYLHLLTVQEDNMRRLEEVLKGEDDEDKDREAKARCWIRKRGLAEIRNKIEERENLELILAVDRELRDF